MNVSFQPRYIQEKQLPAYGLPTVKQQPNIMSLVDAASTLIDEHCGRVEVNGNGSLVYSTYTERLNVPSGRNIVRVSYKPIVGLPVETQTALAAKAAAGETGYYTGFEANTQYAHATLSPIISCSGRYGYNRRDSMGGWPDGNYGMNILQVAAFFGGPPLFTTIDVSMIDFDPRTGEIWVPAGLYLNQYTQISVTYNSGFDPRSMPRAVVHACAAMIKNFLGKGSGSTGVKSVSGAGKINVVMQDDVIDSNIEVLLRNYLTTLSM